MTLEKILRKYVRRGEMFELSSGRVSDWYVDVKSASMKPEILHLIAKKIKPYTMTPSANPGDWISLLAGMELGAIPIVTATSLETKIPFLMIRKKKRTTGTAKQIEGDFQPGQKVLLVEDVVTTGDTLLKSIEILRSAGLVCNQAVCVVLRDEGCIAVLKEMGVELFSLVDFSKFVNENSDLFPL